jgi:hypothetical protein
MGTRGIIIGRNRLRLLVMVHRSGSSLGIQSRIPYPVSYYLPRDALSLRVKGDPFDIIE